jgi:hypothetical protein
MFGGLLKLRISLNSTQTPPKNTKTVPLLRFTANLGLPETHQSWIQKWNRIPRSFGRLVGIKKLHLNLSYPFIDNPV